MTTQPYPRTADPSTPSPQLFHSPDGDDLASNISSRHSRANALGAGAANSSKQLVFPEPTTTKLLTKYFPLFPILITFKRANLRVVSTIGLVLFAMQHWAFVLNPHMKDHLGYQLGNVIAYIVYGSQLSFYDPVMVASASVTAFLVVVYLLLAVTLVLVGCILFHLRPMDDHSEGKGITSDAARLLLNVMSTALLIPILQFCFASCVCGSSGYMWMLPNVENAVCWGSSHIAAFIPSLICLIMLIPLLYLKNTCVYDYAILSDTFQSRRHSVVEKMTFVRDVMSCLLFNVMLGWEVPLGFTILHAIFSAILVLSYMFFLPYYSMWMNRFYVCVHTVECLLCVFVACTLNNYFLRDGDAMMVLFFGCGLVITVLCMFCTDYRINPNFEFAMLRTGTCSLRGGGEELDLSDQLDSGSSDMDKPTAQIDDAAVDALPYPIGVFHNTAFSQYVGLNQQVVESIMQQEMSRMVKGGMGSVKQKTYPVLEPYVNHVYVDTDVALAASSIDIYALKFEPEQLSDLMLVYGANLYSRALTTFADDAEVMLAFASFITSYLPGLSFMGVDLVKRVLRGRTTVDHQFRCLRQANELRVALGIRTHAHSIRSLKARTAHGRALQSIHKFWVKLTEPSVNFKEVSEVADMINERCDIAIAHFESALRNMQTADHVLMRRLGDFFSEVMMAPDAAQECYNEGRDIYEARQARSMRGTRQHTSVEIDVVALSERGTEMLRFHRRGYSSKSSSSQIMRQFAIAVLVLFVIITTCGVLLFFAGFGMKDGMKDVIEGILDAAILSVFTAGVSSFVAQYQALATATAVSVGSLPLGTLAPLFLSKYRFLSSGPGKSRSDEAIKLFLEPAIPFYSVAVPYAGAYSLSTMSELYLQALNQFVNASAAGSISGGTLNELFLISSGGVLSRSYQSYMSEMISADIPIFANKWIAWCTVVFICAVLVIAMVQISIGFALRKTAMSRVFAYQLFTLIPFDALEKLAMESKERYHRIQVDKSFKENADRLDGKGEIANDVEHQYTSDSNKAYVGDSAGKVKSCLKGANGSAEGGADTRGRRVRFNPVVQVVGQVDDKKAEAAGRSDDADEDDAALSMTLRDQQQKRQKGIDSSVSVDERLARISLIVSVALFCVVGLCVIGLAVCLAIVLVTHRSKYAPNIEQYTHFQKSVMTAGFLPSQSVQSTLNFIRSGSLLEFQNCQNFISNLYELIPKLVGDLIPTDASQNLVRMHQLAQLMGNVTLDASVVAAKYHGVSLQYSSNARASDAMDEAELLQKMAKKYPKANATATTVVQNLRGNQDFALQFAYVIVGINIPSFSAEYRKLYFDVVTSVGNQAYSDVSMRSLALTLSLVFPIAAIFILALVLLIRPLRRIVELCIPRNILIAAIISFGVVVAVGFVMFAKAYRLENEYREFNTSLSSLTHFVDNLLSGMENFIGFVLTARQLYWFNGKAVNPLATMNALSDSIVESYLSSLDAGMIQNVFRAGYKINLLDQIGCSLTISSMMETNQFVEAEMIASLPPSNWDLLVEPEYIKLEVHYGDNIFYTNKTHDMNLPLAERYAMAVKIVSGPEYSDNVDIIYKGVANLWTTFVTEEYADSHNILDSQNALLYVSLGLCALPIASAIIFGALVVSAIRKSLNLDGKVGDGLVADNRAFKTMLRRSEFGLVSLGILYAATFAMGIWLTQTVDVYANVIAVSTASVVNVAMLSYYFGLQVSPFITYVSEDFIDESVSHLIYDFNLQFVKEQQQSVPVGLGLSTEYDHFVFGTTALASNVNTMTRFITNNCSQPFATEYSFPLVPAAEQPFLELLLSLNQILLPYIDPTKDFAQRRATVDPASLVSIVKMELSLFSYGVNSSELVFSAITNQHNIYSAIYIFLALLAIVGTIVVIAAVIVPIILLLIHEEEAIRMLLHLIPTHVAEEVPAIAQYLETGNTSNSSELQKKFEASEKLLQNILPEKIAARLKTGEQPIADTHDCVTMLFTDFVGFTKRSSTMQAREIVDFLNEVFLEFDTVVELLSLEKIKTIGDAFFMAAGLDAQMRDHALRVVEAGLMFFEALEEHNRRHPSRVPLQMRLGVHSGPVVAGVIGIKKVAYDLWGDSVEIANAMESTGVPGYVHISESTAELVRGFFKLEPRGELPREKEHIPDDMPNTYLVVGRLLPTPYMHLRRPKLGAADVSNSK